MRNSTDSLPRNHTLLYDQAVNVAGTHGCASPNRTSHIANLMKDAGMERCRCFF
ncbi:MAG: hypothetical protein LBU42_08490 [Prevotellaceae bacterium]|nr:hypothetical protein [Prevotellaceae bacterium]